MTESCRQSRLGLMLRQQIPRLIDEVKKLFRQVPLQHIQHMAAALRSLICSTVTPLTAPVSVFSGRMVSKSTRTRSAAFSAAEAPESDLISLFSSVFCSCRSVSSCVAAVVCSCTASAPWIAARYSGKSMCRRLLPREMISNSCRRAISVRASFSRSIQVFHSVCFRPIPVKPCCLRACFMDTLTDRPRVCSVATGI